MRVTRITLDNYQAYGKGQIKLDRNEHKNVTIIAGKNGYGKTTFLTALVWVMYGPLMQHVEKKYKAEINSHGGYENFLKACVNQSAISQYENMEVADVEMSVEVEFSDVMIPSVPCQEILIKRSYSYKNNDESLSILIDGQENELTKEVGYEVFINDFILPREIAKFFFFDAEKIVSLAEAKTKPELRSLSKAYSEVLGIKKYEDLKYTLNTLLTKLRRSGVKGISQKKLQNLIEIDERLKKAIKLNEKKIQAVNESLNEKKNKIDIIEENLIREGNSITIEELSDLKSKRLELKDDLELAKDHLKEVMDLVPLAIAEREFESFVMQLKVESAAKKSNSEIALAEIKKFSSELKRRLISLPSFKGKESEIEQKINEVIKERKKDLVEKETRIFIDYSEKETRDIIATYDYVTNSFRTQFENISKNEKNIRQQISRLNRKIKQAISKKENPVTQQLNADKKVLKSAVKSQEEEKNLLLQELGKLKAELNSNAKVLSEYEKQFKLAVNDRKKYETTQKLLDKINTFIIQIKEDKKYALEKSICRRLQALMHKKRFVSKVEIHIKDDVMDIDLIKSDGSIIDKDSMSKGEQQLYATALLKALVDESKIEFPIFIDSPLQKFDFEHSNNIIEQFYPSIANQVIIFPLLEKELTRKEYMVLKPNINSTYLISNSGGVSYIDKVEIENLFEKFNEQTNVFTY